MVTLPTDRDTANLMELRRMTAFRAKEGASRRRLLELLERIERALAAF